MGNYIEIIVNIIILLLLTNVNSEFIRYSGIDFFSVSRYTQLILCTILYVIYGMKLARKREFSHINKYYVWIFILLALCFLSILWSQDKDATFKNSTFFTGATIYAIYLSESKSKEYLVEIITAYFFTVAVLSTFISIFYPVYGLQIDHRYSAATWRGIFDHRNTLGSFMCLGALVSFLNIRISKNIYRRVFSALTFGLCLTNLFYSKSTTSILVFIVVLGICITIFLRHKFNSFVFIIVINIFFLGFIFNKDLFNSIFNGYLNRDITLTGRVYIWDFCVKALEHKPLLGYGFRAFWVDNNPIATYITVFFDGIDSAHNGYLEWMLQLGIIGLIIYLIPAFKYLYERQKTSYKNNYVNIFPIIFLNYILISFFSERMSSNFLWLMYVISLVKFGYKPTETTSSII